MLSLAPPKTPGRKKTTRTTESSATIECHEAGEEAKELSDVSRSCTTITTLYSLSLFFAGGRSARKGKQRLGYKTNREGSHKVA